MDTCNQQLKRHSIFKVGHKATFSRYCAESEMIKAECKRPFDDEGEEDEERDEFYPNGPPAKASSSRFIKLLEMDYFKSLTEQPPPSASTVTAPTREGTRTESAAPSAPTLPISTTSLNQVS